MKTNVQTQSGNRIVVEFDGKQVGLCQSVKPTDNYAPEAAYGIGDIHALEYVPTKAQHSIVVKNLVLMKDNLRALGILPENGDEVLKGHVFDLCIYGKDDGKLLRKFVGCSYATGSFEVAANKIVSDEVTFNALDVVSKGL